MCPTSEEKSLIVFKGKSTSCSGSMALIKGLFDSFRGEFGGI